MIVHCYKYQWRICQKLTFLHLLLFSWQMIQQVCAGAQESVFWEEHEVSDIEKTSRFKFNLICRPIYLVLVWRLTLFLGLTCAMCPQHIAFSPSQPCLLTLGAVLHCIMLPSAYPNLRLQCASLKRVLDTREPNSHLLPLIYSRISFIPLRND
jgi:hypothetical protein